MAQPPISASSRFALGDPRPAPEANGGLLAFLLRTTGLTPVAPTVPPHLALFAAAAGPSASHAARAPAAADAPGSVGLSFAEMARRVRDLVGPTGLGVTDLVEALQSRMMDIRKRVMGRDRGPVVVARDRVTGETRPLRGAGAAFRARETDRAAARDPNHDRALLDLVNLLNPARSSGPSGAANWREFSAQINALTVRLPVRTVLGRPVSWAPGAGDTAVLGAGGGRPAARVGQGRSHLCLPGRDGAERSVIGVRAMDCSESPEVTRRIMEDKRREIAAAIGVAPEAVRLVHHPDLVPGTPVLIADENLVSAARVNSGWSAETLTQAFGGRAFGDFWADIARRRAASSGRADAARRLGAALAAMDPDAVAAAAVPVRQVETERGPGPDAARIVVKPSTVEAVREDTGLPVGEADLRDLLPGSYRVFQEVVRGWGAQEVGVLRVRDGAATMFAWCPRADGSGRELREHSFNASRPSHLPARGASSGEPPRFAHEGRYMPKTELVELRRALREGYASLAAKENAERAARRRDATEARRAARPVRDADAFAAPVAGSVGTVPRAA